jgi:hypothetical protein
LQCIIGYISAAGPSCDRIRRGHFAESLEAPM